MIVDDHAMVRSGLSAFISAADDLELVGEAANGTEAVRMCADARPDVILMDLVMPGMDGVATTRAIRERFPNVRVIALTSFPEDRLVQDVLEAGALSYLLKNVGVDDLARAIRAARAGQSTLAPEAAQVLTTGLSYAKEGDKALFAIHSLLGHSAGETATRVQPRMATMPPAPPAARASRASKAETSASRPTSTGHTIGRIG